MLSTRVSCRRGCIRAEAWSVRGCTLARVKVGSPPCTTVASVDGSLLASFPFIVILFSLLALLQSTMAFFWWESDALARTRPAGLGWPLEFLRRNRDLMSRLAMSGRQAFYGCALWHPIFILPLELTGDASLPS